MDRCGRSRRKFCSTWRFPSSFGASAISPDGRCAIGAVVRCICDRPNNLDRKSIRRKDDLRLHIVDADRLGLDVLLGILAVKNFSRLQRMMRFFPLALLPMFAMSMYGDGSLLAHMGIDFV